MRILWATNTPALAEDKINKKLVRGGWIKSLQKALMEYTDDIELGIVFLSNKEEKFEINGVQYYSIKRKGNNKLKRFVFRLINKVEGELNLDKFRAIISEFDPDIIHIHGTENEFGLIHKYTAIPVVVSIQGNLVGILQKYFSGISIKEVKKYTGIKTKIISSNYINSFKRLQKKALVEREILGGVKYVIGRTDWDRRITKILSPYSKYYHNDEVLRDQFYSNVWKNVNLDFTIFTTTGGGAYKGLETLLDTAILLKRHNFKFVWKVAGVDYKSQISDICRKSRGIIWEDIGVHLLGKLDEYELVAEMLKTSIFVQVSHIENSSNSLCEAMILGMPIIATDAGGTSSLLTNKKEGILIQDGNPYELAGAILEARNNYNDKLLKYCKNARKRALERHNGKKIVSELIGIYENILSIK